MSCPMTFEAEEDIKEVKQNFYRVMHCAFAKYEQGFKRKNDYLEKRRIKKKEDIEKGVEQELQKRGLQGRLEDPLLSTVNVGGNAKTSTHIDLTEALQPYRPAIGFNKHNADDESSLGLGFGGIGLEDDS